MSPLVGFICPDKVATSDCLKECRLGRRCLTLATLKAVSYDRPPVPFHTTQLLNGTMMEFLKATTDFYISPESRAFSLHGVRHHEALELWGDAFSEITFRDEVSQGRIDQLEQRPDGRWGIRDYKTWGAFSVAKFLGLTSKLIDDPGGATYRRSGKRGGGGKYKAGDIKQIKVWYQDPEKAETEEVELQLSDYCNKARKTGFDVDENDLMVQITPRDGGIDKARKNGVDFLMRLFPVKYRPDAKEYFAKKAQDLQQALSQGYWNKPCSEKENWGKRRCKGYCEVFPECRKLLSKEC